MRAPLLPSPSADPAPVSINDFNGLDIRTIAPQYGGGERWIGTDGGALHWDGSNPPESISLGGALTFPRPCTRSMSIAVAPFIRLRPWPARISPVRNAWYWYAGNAFTEQSPEWREFGAGPDGTPSSTNVFLPSVLAIRRGPDASLWLGPSAASRVTLHSRSRTAPTRRVSRHSPISVMARSPSCTKMRAAACCFAPSADSCASMAAISGSARRRGGITWGAPTCCPESSRGSAAAGASMARTIAGSASTRMVPAGLPRHRIPHDRRSGCQRTSLTDGVVADLGSFNGETFTHASNVNASDIYLHIKPQVERIVSGGMPYIRACPRAHRSGATYRASPRICNHRRPATCLRGARKGGSSRRHRHSMRPTPAASTSTLRRTATSTRRCSPTTRRRRVTFEFEPRMPCPVLVRLYRRTGDPPFDPAVLDRVWEGIQLVRPAGVRALLAVDESIVRGS